jgi:hypothetical protein
MRYAYFNDFSGSADVPSALANNPADEDVGAPMIE